MAQSQLTQDFRLKLKKKIIKKIRKLYDFLPKTVLYLFIKLNFSKNFNVPESHFIIAISTFSSHHNFD